MKKQMTKVITKPKTWIMNVCTKRRGNLPKINNIFFCGNKLSELLQLTVTSLYSVASWRPVLQVLIIQFLNDVEVAGVISSDAG